MNLVIFDGMSGSGKSTLRTNVMKLKGFDILTIDRFTPSIWVYDKLRGVDRTDEMALYEKALDELLSPLVVITRCSPLVAAKRDQKIDVEFSYEQEYDMFWHYVLISEYKNLIRIDTSELSTIECAEYVVERL